MGESFLIREVAGAPVQLHGITAAVTVTISEPRRSRSSWHYEFTGPDIVRTAAPLSSHTGGLRG